MSRICAPALTAGRVYHTGLTTLAPYDSFYLGRGCALKLTVKTSGNACRDLVPRADKFANEIDSLFIFRGTGHDPVGWSITWVTQEPISEVLNPDFPFVAEYRVQLAGPILEPGTLGLMAFASLWTRPLGLWRLMDKLGR